MPILRVKGFSAIRNGTINVSDMTVLIGPQASGKSVLSKLLYFFYDILDSSQYKIQTTTSFADYQEGILRSFCEWFPPPAWGKKRFEIHFEAGPFAARILPRTRANRDGLPTIQFSQFYKDYYEATKLEFDRGSEQLKDPQRADILKQLQF